MPSARTGALPQFIVDFASAVEVMEPEHVPRDVETVVAHIRGALPQEQPKTCLARSLAALHRQRPTLLPSIGQWLMTLETRWQMATGTRGHPFAGMRDVPRRWIAACSAIAAGATVRSTLLVVRAGRPHTRGFSHVDDAGLLAAYLQRIVGEPVPRALRRARDLLYGTEGSLSNVAGPDVHERDVRHAHARVVLRPPSNRDLVEQAQVLSRKYAFELPAADMRNV